MTKSYIINTTLAQQSTKNLAEFSPINHSRWKAINPLETVEVRRLSWDEVHGACFENLERVPTLRCERRLKPGPTPWNDQHNPVRVSVYAMG